MTDPGLRASHLLLLPADTDPEDVEALAVTRYPEATRDPDGALRIGRHVTLVGPLGADDARELGVWTPSGGPSVYALRCPVEREDPPMPGTSHPDGLHRAFADGMPIRAEARSVELLIAIARRLGGSVRIAGSGIVLRPDPATRIDLTVHSPYWLEPETVLGVVQLHQPNARLAIEGETWMGPPPGLVDDPPDELSAALPPDLRVALHASADRMDAATLDAPDVLDAFAVVDDLGPGGRYGCLEVLVHPEETPIPALAGLEWADQVITYEVRWACPDERQAYLEKPSAEHRTSRDYASTAVGLVASALVDATDGVLVDADGFIVDRYDV